MGREIDVCSFIKPQELCKPLTQACKPERTKMTDELPFGRWSNGDRSASCSEEDGGDEDSYHMDNRERPWPLGTTY